MELGSAAVALFLGLRAMAELGELWQRELKIAAAPLTEAFEFGQVDRQVVLRKGEHSRRLELGSGDRYLGASWFSEGARCPGLTNASRC